MVAALFALLLAGCSLQSGALLPDDDPDRDAGEGETGTPPDDAAPPDSRVRDSARFDSAAPPDSSVVVDAVADVPADGPMDTGSPCVPVMETCNAVDDDCDSEIDEDGCDCDRELHDGHVYLFCTGGRTFDQSTSDCASWGYHMIFIDDGAEQTFAWDAASRRIAGDWWIGLSDLTVEDRYEWLDGTVVWDGGPLRYHAFRGGAPDDTSTEDCFEMDVSGGVWAGATCSQFQPFVCESP